jgi:hypothetical protein
LSMGLRCESHTEELPHAMTIEHSLHLQIELRYPLPVKSLIPFGCQNQHRPVQGNGGACFAR